MRTCVVPLGLSQIPHPTQDLRPGLVKFRPAGLVFADLFHVVHPTSSSQAQSQNSAPSKLGVSSQLVKVLSLGHEFTGFCEFSRAMNFEPWHRVTAAGRPRITARLPGTEEAVMVVDREPG